jgi:myo-inositol-1(or 4)-monophosphatase
MGYSGPAAAEVGADGREAGSAAALLELAIAVVGPAAELAHRMRVDGVQDVTTKSTRTDVVTAADRAVERQVVAVLREQRPDDAILGEEFGRVDPGGAVPATGRVRWILDPIDGTVTYLYGIPQYAVSLAAEVDGVVVAGVVRNAATGRQWTATLGGGAHVDGHRLAGSSQTELAQSLVATGFGYAAERRAHQSRVLAELLPKIRDIRRFGAASLDLCMTAEGACDAYFEKGLAPWDRAAGGLIASEAGLLVTGLRGAAAGEDLVLAAPPGLHQRLHDLLVELEADEGP